MKALTVLITLLLAVTAQAGAQALPADAQPPLNLSARKAPANAAAPAGKAQRGAQGEPLEPLILPYGAGFENRTQNGAGGSAGSAGSGGGGGSGSGGGRGGSGRGR